MVGNKRRNPRFDEDSKEQAVTTIEMVSPRLLERQNDFGEPVENGVYFSTLTAGDFATTRKAAQLKIA